MLFALHRATTEGQCGEIMGTSSVTPIPSLESVPVRKLVILLVEDESAVREVTRQVLEHAGYYDRKQWAGDLRKRTGVRPGAGAEERP